MYFTILGISFLKGIVLSLARGPISRGNDKREKVSEATGDAI
jgi:hypothetical protein